MAFAHTSFSVIPSGILWTCRDAAPKIPFIGNAAIFDRSIDKDVLHTGCLYRLFWSAINFPQGSFDILAETRILMDSNLFSLLRLDYLNWKTYVFLYFALTLGAGSSTQQTGCH